ncbi:hypothetical protein FXO37_16776 [Capsicum annuum]|nr:hypothetical protein FXO37_16776 [Capsicum annuum]
MPPKNYSKKPKKSEDSQTVSFPKQRQNTRHLPSTKEYKVTQHEEQRHVKTYDSISGPDMDGPFNERGHGPYSREVGVQTLGLDNAPSSNIGNSKHNELKRTQVPRESHIQEPPLLCQLPLLLRDGNPKLYAMDISEQPQPSTELRGNQQGRRPRKRKTHNVRETTAEKCGDGAVPGNHWRPKQRFFNFGKTPSKRVEEPYNRTAIVLYPKEIKILQTKPEEYDRSEWQSQ